MYNDESIPSPPIVDEATNLKKRFGHRSLSLIFSLNHHLKNF